MRRCIPSHGSVFHFNSRSCRCLSSRLRVFAVLFLFLFSAFWFPSSGYAACFSPAGNAADIIYYGGYQSDMYCNGGEWVSMGGPVGNTTTGLVGWWKLDDGSGTSAADSSGNGNTGTLFNTPTWTTSGMNNGALTFSATGEHVDAADVASLEISGSWTVATWVNPSALPSAGNTAALLAKYASGPANYLLLINNGYQCAGLGWSVGFDSSDHNNHYDCVASSISVGTWYHVVGVWNSSSSNIYLYVNGQLIGTANESETPASGSGSTFQIGENNGGSSWFNGTLDDVRVYNRALSATDIETLYTSTGGGSGDINTGLIHYWKLDEAAGVTTGIADSAAAETGTMTGAGATFTAGGKINDAFSQPGGLTSYISVGSLANITSLSHFTESFWYKRGAANAYLSAGQEDASPYPNGISIEVGNTNQFVSFSITDTSSADYGSAADANDTNWHMATLVFDGTQTGNAARLMGYIDGAQRTLAFTGTIPATTTSNARTWYLGDVNITEGNQGNGKIDEIRLYNRSLSASDVLTLYNTYATACASPAGYTGDLSYNNDSHVPQFCNGASWIPVGPVPGAGGGGCSSPTGSEGTFVYNADNHVLQYCDGTNWVAAGENIPISGLVGWWNFDEGSGTSAADSSGNGNTGTLTGTPLPTWTTSGQANGALTLVKTSSQYVNVPDAASLQLVGSWTVSIWVNPTTVPASGNGVKVVTKDDASGHSNYGVAIANNLNGCASLGWRIYFETASGGVSNSCYLTTINPGTWYHVVGEWDSVAKDLLIYLNGVLVTTQNIPVNVPTSASGAPLELGNESGTSGYLNGTIDDVRVYNRALSASEIWRLYNGAP